MYIIKSQQENGLIYQTIPSLQLSILDILNNIVSDRS